MCVGGWGGGGGCFCLFFLIFSSGLLSISFFREDQHKKINVCNKRRKDACYSK